MSFFNLKPSWGKKSPANKPKSQSGWKNLDMSWTENLGFKNKGKGRVQGKGWHAGKTGKQDNRPPFTVAPINPNLPQEEIDNFFNNIQPQGKAQPDPFQVAKGKATQTGADWIGNFKQRADDYIKQQNPVSLTGGNKQLDDWNSFWDNGFGDNLKNWGSKLDAYNSSLSDIQKFEDYYNYDDYQFNDFSDFDYNKANSANTANNKFLQDLKGHEDVSSAAFDEWTKANQFDTNYDPYAKSMNGIGDNQRWMADIFNQSYTPDLSMHSVSNFDVKQDGLTNIIANAMKHQDFSNIGLSNIDRKYDTSSLTDKSVALGGHLTDYSDQLGRIGNAFNSVDDDPNTYGLMDQLGNLNQSMDGMSFANQSGWGDARENLDTIWQDSFNGLDQNIINKFMSQNGRQEDYDNLYGDINGKINNLEGQFNTETSRNQEQFSDWQSQVDNWLDEMSGMDISNQSDWRDIESQMFDQASDVSEYNSDLTTDLQNRRNEFQNSDSFGDIRSRLDELKSGRSAELDRISNHRKGIQDSAQDINNFDANKFDENSINQAQDYIDNMSNDGFSSVLDDGLWDFSDEQSLIDNSISGVNAARDARSNELNSLSDNLNEIDTEFDAWDESSYLNASNNIDQLQNRRSAYGESDFGNAREDTVNSALDNITEKRQSIATQASQYNDQALDGFYDIESFDALQSEANQFRDDNADWDAQIADGHWGMFDQHMDNEQSRLNNDGQNYTQSMEQMSNNASRYIDKMGRSNFNLASKINNGSPRQYGYYTQEEKENRYRPSTFSSIIGGY